ncbi:hypothetical protein Efla_002513 [Eimeria flavescens]
MVDIFPHWLAPGERRPDAFFTDSVNDQLQHMRPEKTLPVAQPTKYEPQCLEISPLTDEATEPALGPEPLREGLRWKLARPAEPAPEGVFVKFAGNVELEQAADDMVRVRGFSRISQGTRHGVAEYGEDWLACSGSYIHSSLKPILLAISHFRIALNVLLAQRAANHSQDHNQKGFYVCCLTHKHIREACLAANDSHHDNQTRFLNQLQRRRDSVKDCVGDYREELEEVAEGYFYEFG